MGPVGISRTHVPRRRLEHVQAPSCRHKYFLCRRTRNFATPTRGSACSPHNTPSRTCIKKQCAGTVFCLVRPVRIAALRTRQSLPEKYLPPQVLYIRTAIAVRPVGISPTKYRCSDILRAAVFTPRYYVWPRKRFRVLHATCPQHVAQGHSRCSCPPGRTRTYDQVLKRHLLYQLSYGRMVGVHC